MVTDADIRPPSQTFLHSFERDGDSWLAVLDDSDVGLVADLEDGQRCQVFHRGHTPHPIQLNLAFNEPHRKGQLVGRSGEVIIVAFDDDTKIYRNHEADKVVTCVGLGGEVRVCETYGLLRASNGQAFSISEDDLLGECDFEPFCPISFDEIEGRLVSHGGYVIAGPQARELLHEDETSADGS
jgi:hypothetical protein